MLPHLRPSEGRRRPAGPRPMPSSTPFPQRVHHLRDEQSIDVKLRRGPALSPMSTARFAPLYGVNSDVSRCSSARSTRSAASTDSDRTVGPTQGCRPHLERGPSVHWGTDGDISGVRVFKESEQRPETNSKSGTQTPSILCKASSTTRKRTETTTSASDNTTGKNTGKFRANAVCTPSARTKTIDSAALAKMAAAELRQRDLVQSIEDLDFGSGWLGHEDDEEDGDEVDHDETASEASDILATPEGRPSGTGRLSFVSEEEMQTDIEASVELPDVKARYTVSFTYPYRGLADRQMALRENKTRRFVFDRARSHAVTTLPDAWWTVNGKYRQDATTQAIEPSTRSRSDSSSECISLEDTGANSVTSPLFDPQTLMSSLVDAAEFRAVDRFGRPVNPGPRSMFLPECNKPPGRVLKLHDGALPNDKALPLVPTGKALPSLPRRFRRCERTKRGRRQVDLKAKEDRDAWEAAG